MRFFPSAPRRRVFAAATVACAVSLGVVAIPAIADDDLKDKKRRVEQQIDHAHDDLEHSSKAVRRASADLVNAQAQLRDARHELAVVRDKLGVARETDARILLTRITAAYVYSARTLVRACLPLPRSAPSSPMRCSCRPAAIPRRCSARW